MKKVLFVLFVIVTLTSCDQYVTRRFGGDTTIELKKGEKLIEVTWKSNGDLWYLVEPMDSDYTPKTKVFKESSLYGLMEGSVKFIESK